MGGKVHRRMEPGNPHCQGKATTPAPTSVLHQPGPSNFVDHHAQARARGTHEYFVDTAAPEVRCYKAALRSDKEPLAKTNNKESPRIRSHVAFLQNARFLDSRCVCLLRELKLAQKSGDACRSDPARGRLACRPQQDALHHGFSTIDLIQLVDIQQDCNERQRFDQAYVHLP